MVASFHMRRSSRVSTASRASSGPVRRPSASPMVCACASTEMQAKSPCWAKVKKVVPFTKASERSLYGSKAVGLGDAARQGLPVPPGVALSGDLVEAVASGEAKSIEKLEKAIAD